VAVFEPHRFELDYVVEPDFGDCRKTDTTTKEDAKANKTERDAWRAAHRGRILVTAAEYARASAIRDAVHSHHDAREYLAAGLAEQTLTWPDPRTGLGCKGRVDFISTSKHAILDLKTSADILLERFSRSVLRYGYHCQGAFYTGGYGAVEHREIPFVIIAVESSEPFDVGVFRLDDESLALGAEECAELLAKVKDCRSRKTWPGQYPIEMPLRLPPWAFGDDENVSDLGLED
jgi:hypothetical protein